MQLDRAQAGMLLVVLSAVCWSTAGFFTRLIALDAWTILFWRAVFAAVLTGLCALWFGPRAARGSLWHFPREYWWIVVWMTSGTMAFIPALKLTSVADVVIIYATTPLMAAFLAWLWLRERVQIPTLAACVVALFGVATMVEGNDTVANRWGLILAFGMALSMAAMTVSFRRHAGVDCWRVGFGSNVATAFVAAALAQPLAVGALELTYLMLFALVQMTLGLGLYVMGTRLLPAVQAALIGILETPLAPFWVWLAFDEVPTTSTVLGGMVVMLAVAGHLLFERQRATWRRVTLPKGDDHHGR